MLAPDTRLKDRYRILHRIGGGGFGHVYKAIDEVFGCSVAIKETREEVASLEKLRKAFEREAKLLRSLKHDALPRVTDYFFHKEAQFLVMDFIDGEDLASLLKTRLHEQKGPFSCQELLPWADKILSALEYLHSRPEPIVHRDIKPSNIKLADDGGVYLLDFGLAKGATGQMSTIIEGQSSFSLAGFTHEYAPLEQLQDAGTEPQSDVYALGATVYHLLTGHPPISASRRDEASQRGQGDLLRQAHELNPEIPLEVSRVISHALAVRWWDRIASAKEMRSALEHARGEMAAKKLDSTTQPLSQSRVGDTNDELATLPFPRPQESEPPDSVEPALPLAKTLTLWHRVPRARLMTGAALVLLISLGITLRLAFPNWLAPALSVNRDTQAHFSLKKVLTDHTNDPKKHIWSVAFSRSGDLAASASEDGTIILYDAKTWRPKFPPLTGHTGEIYSVAFSPDGTILASASGDATIRRWNTQTGQLIMPTLIGGTNPVLRVAFSPDGNFLASCSGQIPKEGAGEIILWNVRNGWKANKLEGQVKGVYAIAFSPDSQTLASAGLDGQLLLWELANNWQSRILWRYEHKLFTVAFSADGKYLACSNNDTTIRLWIYQRETKLKWQELAEPIGSQNSYITSVAFSPDSKTLISATSDSKISLWDVTATPPKVLRVGQGEKSQWSLAFSPDGQTLLTGGEDNVVRVWE